jgi:hypothetical protein
MGGRRRLKGGAVRVLGTHEGLEGRMFRRGYDALVERFGSFETKLLRLEASRVAAAWVNLEIATRELMAARRRRSKERGRRPGSRDVERLARRQGLADGSYQLALNRLEEMAAQARTQPASGLALLNRVGPR